MLLTGACVQQMFALRSPPLLFFFPPFLSFFSNLDFLKTGRAATAHGAAKDPSERWRRGFAARVSFSLPSIGMWVCPPLVKIHPGTHKPIHYQYTAGAEFKCYEPQEGVDLITRESVNPTPGGFLSICITPDLLLPP